MQSNISKVEKIIELWNLDFEQALKEVLIFEDFRNIDYLDKLKVDISRFLNNTSKTRLQTDKSSYVKKLYRLFNDIGEYEKAKLLVLAEIDSMEQSIKNHISEVSNTKMLHIDPKQKVHFLIQSLRTRATLYCLIDDYPGAIQSLYFFESYFNGNSKNHYDYELHEILARCYAILGNKIKSLYYIQLFLKNREKFDNYIIAAEIAEILNELDVAKEFYTKAINNNGFYSSCNNMESSYFVENNSHDKLYLKRGFVNQKLGRDIAANLDFIMHLFFTFSGSYRLDLPILEVNPDIETFYLREFDENSYPELFMFFSAYNDHKEELIKIFQALNEGQRVLIIPSDEDEDEDEDDDEEPENMMYLSKSNNKKNYLLFLDTESNGLPKDFDAPMSDENNWPRLVQLAYQIYDDTGHLVDERNYIIKPDKFLISHESTKIHGISNENALNNGHPLDYVLKDLMNKINSADVVVGHNLEYDEKIIGAELYRKDYENSLSKKHKICTMKASTNYCKISGNYGYKWPSLTELYNILFSKDFKETHNALHDVRTTAKCYWELVSKGVIEKN